MEDVQLWLICINAFAAVLMLLSVLALIMRLLLVLFPVSKQTSDPAWAAAIQGAVATLYPGARVTHIQEIGGAKK